MTTSFSRPKVFHRINCGGITGVAIFIVLLCGSPAAFGQAASGTLTVKTDSGEAVRRARVVIAPYGGDGAVDTLLTGPDGQAGFSGLSVATGLNGPESEGAGVTVIPNPGASHRIVVRGRAAPEKDRPAATIHSLSGRLVARLEPRGGGSTTTVFRWQPHPGSVDGGIYLFRWQGSNARIIHHPGGSQAGGGKTGHRPGPSDATASLHNTSPDPNYTFSFQPDGSCNITFTRFTREYHLSEGTNNLSETIAPDGFIHFYTVEGNAADANVNIAVDGNEVFAGAVDANKTYRTDSAYLDSREKELNLHVEAPEHETLDSTFVGSWGGQNVTFRLSEKSTPEDTFNHTVLGDAMDGAAVTIKDSQADTILADTDEIEGRYSATFSNTKESQPVQITQSAPNVVQKNWDGTVTDTLKQDLTDVTLHYEVKVEAPQGSDVAVTPRSTGESLNGTEVNYTTDVSTDSADVAVAHQNWQDKDTTVALSYGQNSFDVRLDSLVYSFTGSAGPNGSKIKLFNAADGAGLDSANVSENSYEMGFKRVGALDSVRFELLREDYQDLDTLVREVQTGVNAINLPPLKPDTVSYSLFGSTATDSLDYVVTDKANPQDTLGEGKALQENSPAYSVDFERLATEEQIDSVLVNLSRDNYLKQDTAVDVSEGENAFDLPALKPDTVSYSLFGSTATDSLDYVVTDKANSQDTLAHGKALQENDPDYEFDVTRPATQRLDSLVYSLSREGYTDKDTTMNVSEGENEIDMPGLTEYPEYVENESVIGTIRREPYGWISNAFVKIKGVNVNHKDSITMNDDNFYEFTNIKIPTDAQGEADTAQYVRTITPTDTTSTGMFKPYKDTIKITKSLDDLGDAYVQQYDQNVTLKGTIRDIYDANKRLDSVKVRFKRASDSTLLAESVTDADGKFRIGDIDCNTEGFWEVGYHNHNASGYLSDVGHTYTIKSEVIEPAEDSIETINWMLVPTELPIPATENDPDKGETVTADPEKIDEMIRSPPSSSAYRTDTEEAMGRKVRLNYESMDASEKQTFRDSIIAVGDSLFYGIPKSVPMDDPSRPFKLVNEHIDAEFSNYHPEHNYHPDSLGWNVYIGGNETVPEALAIYENNKQYKETAVNGGDIEVNLQDWAGNLKEIYGRSERRGNVSSYTSFMNIDAAYPTLDDRAIIKLHHKSEKERIGDHPKTYYPLDRLEYSISR